MVASEIAVKDLSFIEGEDKTCEDSKSSTPLLEVGQRSSLKRKLDDDPSLTPATKRIRLVDLRDSEQLLSDADSEDVIETTKENITDDVKEISKIKRSRVKDLHKTKQVQITSFFKH